MVTVPAKVHINVWVISTSKHDAGQTIHYWQKAHDAKESKVAFGSHIHIFGSEVSKREKQDCEGDHKHLVVLTVKNQEEWDKVKAEYEGKIKGTTDSHHTVVCAHDETSAQKWGGEVSATGFVDLSKGEHAFHNARSAIMKAWGLEK